MRSYLHHVVSDFIRNDWKYASPQKRWRSIQIVVARQHFVDSLDLEEKATVQRMIEDVKNDCLSKGFTAEMVVVSHLCWHCHKPLNKASLRSEWTIQSFDDELRNTHRQCFERWFGDTPLSKIIQSHWGRRVEALG